MTWSDVSAWVEEGGLGWFNAWPSDWCFIWDGMNWIRYEGDGPGAIWTPSTVEEGTPNWGHSESHGDKPPRMP